MHLLNYSNVSPNKHKKKLDKVMAEVEETIAKKDYSSDYAFTVLPFDSSILRGVEKVIAEKKKLNPKYVIVCGIGGSNLGALAVQNAVFGRLFNEVSEGTEIFFADTTDPEYLSDIIRLAENTLKSGREIIVNVISKSGTTTETIAIFSLFLDLLRRYRKNYSDYIVAITEKGSTLEKDAAEHGYAVLNIPEKVGGRYSVFSAVGLFPLGMIGINLESLLEGAKEALKHPDIAKELASSVFSVFKSGIRTCVFFPFSNNLEFVGGWYKQLLAESLGKETDLAGKKVSTGITPIVSIGSTDLHSMAQLYIGGPKDKMTIFVSLKRKRMDQRLRESMLKEIEGKNVGGIMDAILGGVKETYRKRKMPFFEIQLNDAGEKSVGALLQMLELQVMFLGRLMNVNPFDQPNVEEYKKETRKILGRI